MAYFVLFVTVLVVGGMVALKLYEAKKRRGEDQAGSGSKKHTRRRGSRKRKR